MNMEHTSELPFRRDNTAEKVEEIERNFQGITDERG